MVQSCPTVQKGLSKIRQLCPDAGDQHLPWEEHGPPAKIFAVRKGGVCPHPDAIALCASDGFHHGVHIPYMPATGNATGTDKGKDFSLMADSLPQITVGVYFQVFHGFYH